MKELITLGHLLYYLDCDEDRIQITNKGEDWNVFSELPTDSFLLKPFLNWYVNVLEPKGPNIIHVEIEPPVSKGETE